MRFCIFTVGLGQLDFLSHTFWFLGKLSELSVLILKKRKDILFGKKKLWLWSNCTIMLHIEVQTWCMILDSCAVCHGAVCHGAVCHCAVCQGVLCHGADCYGNVCHETDCHGVVCHGAAL